jgi:hypothetical protein
LVFLDGFLGGVRSHSIVIPPSQSIIISPSLFKPEWAGEILQMRFDGLAHFGDGGVVGLVTTFSFLCWTPRLL